MSILKPKFMTFDCYGTLINFEMAPVARRVYADRLSGEALAFRKRQCANPSLQSPPAH